jgi:hypothetical protein
MTDSAVNRRKIPSEGPVFRLSGVELVKMTKPVYHVSRFLPIVRRSVAPFTFVLCFTLPFKGRILGLVLIFEADRLLSSGSGSCLGSSGASDEADGQDDDEDEDEDDQKLSPFDLCMARRASVADAAHVIPLQSSEEIFSLLAS